MTSNSKAKDGIILNFNDIHQRSRNKVTPFNLNSSNMGTTSKLPKPLFRSNNILNENSAYYYFRSMIAKTNDQINIELKRAKDLRSKYDIKLNKKIKKVSCPAINVNKSTFSIPLKDRSLVTQVTPKKFLMTGLEEDNLIYPIAKDHRQSVAASLFKSHYRLERLSSNDISVTSNKVEKKTKKQTNNSLAINSDMKQQFNNLLSANSAKNILQKMENSEKSDNMDLNENSETEEKNQNEDILNLNERIERMEIGEKNEKVDKKEIPEIILGKNIFMSAEEREERMQVRKKEYKVKYVADWYARTGIPENKLPKKIAEDMQLQYHIINDEMKVISENMQHYKLSCLNTVTLLHAFQSLERSHQVKLNVLLEETCGLMLEVSNRILADFADYLEKFLSMQPPHPAKFSGKYVRQEEKAFLFNVGVFNEISAFMKSCQDVYSTLVRQVDDMIIPFSNLQVILQFLARIRLNLSNLLFSSKNYMKNFRFDVTLVEKFATQVPPMDDIEKDDKQAKNIKIKKFKNNRQDIVEKMRNQFDFKKNEYNNRIRRLNNILFIKQKKDDDSFEIKKKKLGKEMIKNAGLNSKIVDKLLKYCSKDIKFQIMSERIMNRHREREDEEN